MIKKVATQQGWSWTSNLWINKSGTLRTHAALLPGKNMFGFKSIRMYAQENGYTHLGPGDKTFQRAAKNLEQNLKAVNNDMLNFEVFKQQLCVNEASRGTLYKVFEEMRELVERELVREFNELDGFKLEAQILASLTSGWLQGNSPSKHFHQESTPIQNFKPTTAFSEKPEMSNKKVITNTKDLRRIKIEVSNPIESKAVQEELFKNGCYWLTNPGYGQSRDTTPQHCGLRYLYVESDGTMLYGSSKGYFNQSEFTEIKFDLRNFEVTELVPTIVTKTSVSTFYKEKETVEFGGKKYIKEDLEKALSLLKSV